MATSIFSASGLASGLDTNSIIDKLVQLESQPLKALQTQQQAIKSQVSALGDIASKLAALSTATQDLGSAGVVGLRTTSSNTAFSATADSTALAGGYGVEVLGLARVGKWRSAGFAPTEVVTGGTLHLTSQGTGYDIQVGDGATLADVASAIRASGAPVSAAVITSGTSSYLSVTNRDSGHPLTGNAAAGLSLSMTTSGTAGRALGFAQVQAAANASFTVDGLQFTRTSNLVADALPGVTISLQAVGGPEELTLAVDASATQTRLQTFVDAFNAVMGALQRQLSPGEKTDRKSTLAGDSVVRDLQGRLQSLLSSAGNGSAAVRSLADLGLKFSKEGALSLDPDVLKKALAADPGAVNSIFSQPGTGLAALTRSLTSDFTDPASGLLVNDQTSLNDRLSLLSQRQATLQAGIDAYRANLVARFTAMEAIISRLKATGEFLTSQANAASSSKG